jgi:hypothetical protein
MMIAPIIDVQLSDTSHLRRLPLALRQTRSIKNQPAKNKIN